MPIEIDNFSLFVSLEWLAKLLENFVQLSDPKASQVTFGLIILVQVGVHRHGRT